MNKIYDHVHQLPRPSVTSVTLLGNNFVFDDATVEMLLKLKEEKPSLISLCGLALDQTEANFKRLNLRPADARLLASEIIVRPSLTSINLSNNNLTNYGDDMTGIKSIADALVTSITSMRSQRESSWF